MVSSVGGADLQEQFNIPSCKHAVAGSKAGAAGSNQFPKSFCFPLTGVPSCGWGGKKSQTQRRNPTIVHGATTVQTDLVHTDKHYSQYCAYTADEQ